MMNVDPSTAQGAYGFNSWTTAQPGGMAIMPETQVGSSGEIPGAVMSKLPLHSGSPLFWLLILVLVWTGYLYGGFNFGIKKVVKGSFGVG
jgi:hypothetical protein